jgi:Fic family protein
MSNLFDIFDILNNHVEAVNMLKTMKKSEKNKAERAKPYNHLPDLPPLVDLESPMLLKASIKANRLLGELKGYCQTLPDPRLLINTIVVQESKDSSEIENIVTTQDELYKAIVSADDLHGVSPATKEVLLYREALYHGLDTMQTRGLTTNALVTIMQRLKNTNEEIRKIPGTKLANPNTGEIIYTPPEGEDLIRKKLFALEKFIHDDKQALDPLIKLALIHYQFEAIHPFSDGNGRTGRILNVLYLVHENLLTLPVLYLSLYIIKNKSLYYKLLREVTEKQSWNEWILFMLAGISETSILTLQKINAIQKLKEETATQVKAVLNNSYSRDLLDVLFSFPYVKIKVLETNGIAPRQTASVYLKKLAKAGILRPLKMGSEWYFVNHRLMDIISK